MSLAIQVIELDGALTYEREARVHSLCQTARDFEMAGDYESARETLSEIWPQFDECPHLDGLDRLTTGEVLLRVGVLTGYIGSSKQIAESQEDAKNLITQGLTVFESLGEKGRVAEAYSDLAVCYWREGAFDEARVTLGEAFNRLRDSDHELHAKVLLRGALIEHSASRLHDALSMLTYHVNLFNSTNNHALQGGFHGQLATVLKDLGFAELRTDYTDRALIEFAAASFHFEQAGHTRYRARVENNLGFLFCTIGQFAKAHEHLDRAQNIFASLRDRGSIAQVDETRARTLLAQGRYAEAERFVKGAVQVLLKGGEQSLLSEALTTYGRALARLGRHQSAQQTFEQAAEVAEQAGDPESAGEALLTTLEELGDRLTHNEFRIVYERADDLLSRSQHLGILARLRHCARRVLTTHKRSAEYFEAPTFVHASEQTAALLNAARTVSLTDGCVLLTGETGTGKEVLARAIHGWSGRTGKFVTINCATLTETLFESQIFGHRKGSFTDAIENYEGAARTASGGTLFLDEIAELSHQNQGKLLRLIERREVLSVGSLVPETVNVRIIAATNRDIKGMVATGLFREDLFYRLETFHLTVPPLRERCDDIPALATYFIGETLRRHGKQVTFTPEAITAMRTLPLKGNARELQSLIERTVVTAPDAMTITKEMVEVMALRQTHRACFADPWLNFSLKEEVNNIEQRFIEMALKDADGMVSRAARLLGFKYHESLNSLLKHRFPHLLGARTPVTTRRRSIIRSNAL